MSGILIYSAFNICLFVDTFSYHLSNLSITNHCLISLFRYGAFNMLQYLNIDSILTFPVTLATPSFSCERSADEKLPEASE